MFSNGSEFRRKENAYVFDFDPARTLTIFEEFANDLYSDTAAGRGDIETRKKNIRELLNFFPVIGEDENGEMIELDAEKVLSIPRKIKSMEVVRRGFMSNFLFQNINMVFSAPKEVIEIIENFEAVSEPNRHVNFSEEVKQDLSLDDEGNVSLDDEMIIGLTTDIFGEKHFEEVGDLISEAVTEYGTDESPTAIDNFKSFMKDNTVKNIVDTVKSSYGDDLKASDQRKIQRKLNNESDKIIDKVSGNYDIEKNIIEQQRTEAMQSRHETGKTTEEINREFDKKQEEATIKFQDDLSNAIRDFVEESTKETVKTVETKVKERERDEIEDGIKDHLRGFSRTIPSFLMAYGDEKVTLATFDTVIPDNVFKEVTSITLEQFRFLRDGGTYTDSETGEEKVFKGNLFDSVVFDDSVKEFLNLKKKLADYFDEKAIEDIFDYIPPQKTNQIFTPKMVVKKMVDMLEEENPGCFDNPDKTFVDLYMKSGLYITEIVKRLYQSPKLKELYPDKKKRLQHIFEKQVYGLAPTEIIYKIATSFILGFDEDVTITKHNFKQVDALPFAKEGTLKEYLDVIYPEDE
jgi:uncharacterized FlaG/YvyC family protein